MAITYFDETTEFLINYFRIKPFKEGFLLITDYGSWIFLSKQEYALLISTNAFQNVELFNLLKEKGFVITSDNIKDIINFYQKRYNFLSNGVSVHTLFISDERIIMDNAIAEKTVNFIFQSPSRSILIEFRDDLLPNFDIISYIVDYSKRLAYKFNKELVFKLVSNLKGMNDNIFDFLIKEHFQITTFLDGPKEIHEKNNEYTNGNSYDSVINWINKLSRKYQVHVVPHITNFSLKNHKEIVNEYLKYNRNYISLTPLSIANFNKYWNEIGYDALDFLDFWKKTIDYIVKINNQKVFIEELALAYLRNILQKQGMYHKYFTSPQLSITSNLAYKPDGSIFPNDEAVNHDVFKLGDVTTKYADVILSPQSIAFIRASINDHPIIDTNAYKPYLSICPVCSYAANKNIMSKFPNFRYKIQNGVLDYLFEKIIFDEDYRRVFLNWIK